MDTKFERIFVGKHPLYVPVITEEESTPLPVARPRSLPPPGPSASWNPPRYYTPAHTTRALPIPKTLRPAPAPEAMATAVVHVSGGRVAWSLTPTWSPLAPAEGPAYEAARAASLAGVELHEKAHRAIRLLLNRKVKGVLVHGTAGRTLFVSRPMKGGSIRTAWSDTPDWDPMESGRTAAYLRAQARDEAGIAVGVEGLKACLSVGF